MLLRQNNELKTNLRETQVRSANYQNGLISAGKIIKDLREQFSVTLKSKTDEKVAVTGENSTLRKNRRTLVNGMMELNKGMIDYKNAVQEEKGEIFDDVQIVLDMNNELKTLTETNNSTIKDMSEEKSKILETNKELQTQLYNIHKVLQQKNNTIKTLIETNNLINKEMSELIKAKSTCNNENCSLKLTLEISQDCNKTDHQADTVKEKEDENEDINEDNDNVNNQIVCTVCGGDLADIENKHDGCIE